MKLIRKLINFIFQRNNISNIDKIYLTEKEIKYDIVSNILCLSDKELKFVDQEERALPSSKEFYETGYYHTMLKRYFFAGKKYCENKKVLDSCSGVGWGTYILSQYASRVDAFDLDKDSIVFSQNKWDTKKINWFVDDALEISQFSNNYYDVAVAMETIEHFSKVDGEIYINLLMKKLKNNGVLIGTSSFPATRVEANNLCLKNKYHIYIWTEDEIKELLIQYFRKVEIINKWMFIASDKL